MTDSQPSASLGTQFPPWALVPVNVGQATVNLYPVINPTMLPHERAHAFHINKTTFSSQSIDLRVQLDAFGHQLNLSTTVDGVINDWLCHFYDHWFNFGHLSILSFHETKGDQVNDTTHVGNPSILLPVVDGAIGNCRKNVEFVRVQLSVNFIHLVTVSSIRGLPPFVLSTILNSRSPRTR
jgi:hypothetical protein